MNDARLTAKPSTLNGTELTCEEFRDSLRIRLGLVPLGLPERCSGCHQRFTVDHALSCKVGGLVRERHEEVSAEWHQLCAHALGNSAVSDEPTIPTCPTAGIPEYAQANLRGDVGVYGFWRRGTQAIFDIRITDMDAPSHRHADPLKVLKRAENEKKPKYGDWCA